MAFLGRVHHRDVARDVGVTSDETARVLDVVAPDGGPVDATRATVLATPRRHDRVNAEGRPHEAAFGVSTGWAILGSNQ